MRYVTKTKPLNPNTMKKIQNAIQTELKVSILKARLMMTGLAFITTLFACALTIEAMS